MFSLSLKYLQICILFINKQPDRRFTATPRLLILRLCWVETNIFIYFIFELTKETNHKSFNFNKATLASRPLWDSAAHRCLWAFQDCRGSALTSGATQLRWIKKWSTRWTQGAGCSRDFFFLQYGVSRDSHDWILLHPEAEEPLGYSVDSQ